MAVTANFVPDRIDLLPNTPATMTLRLYNGDDERREVSLVASGPLNDHVRLDSAIVTLDPNQIVDVPTAVFAPPTVAADSYTIAVQATVGGTGGPPQDGANNGAPTASEVVLASGTVEISPHSDYSIALQPVMSRGARGGRHTVRVANTGNVALALDLAADDAGDEQLRVAIEPSLLSVPPGLTGDATVRVTPATTYWSGPNQDHVVALHATSAAGRTDALVGAYQQRPKLPNWVGPAAAGAFAALLLGAIAWFAFARPWVQDTADEAAAEAIELDRAALQERIDELEAAAAEAEELPLGTPIDFRLQVEPTGGNTEVTAADVDSDTIVSITDVVFQNPTGAVGTVSLQRGDEVLLRSELANFRDFDLHFVAPYQFDDADEIVLSVECRTPGAGASTCPVGASLVGFVDEVD
ncbi:MAG TPA: hypothetical protein VMW33_04010 [Ilumatobacteraceae bacterium]|nr:hypothetical protein [Ilumatobacteraceae bacterium]